MTALPVALRHRLNLTPGNPSGKSRRTVSDARAAAPTVLAAILAVVIALLGLDATICFGRDGHMTAEPLGVDHHGMSSPGPLSDARLATAAGAHGPCTDTSLNSGQATADPPDASLGAMTLVPVSPPPFQTGRCFFDSTAALPQPASRSTVLRL